MFKRIVAGITTLAIALSLSGVAAVASADEGKPRYYCGCTDPTKDNYQKYLAKTVKGNYRIAAASLPSKVDLSSKYPTPGDQGQCGSCVSFATAYAASSYLQNQEFKWGVDTTRTIYSPAFVHDQISGTTDGISLVEALNFIKINGVCSLFDMPYDQYCYKVKPDSSQKKRALNFKIEGFEALDSINKIKTSLSKGNAVVTCFRVYDDFYNLSPSNPVYDYTPNTTNDDYHAVAIVGYDDSLQAFKIMNSWGTQWGINGYGYVAYSMFGKNKNSCFEVAYAVYDAEQHYKQNPGAVRTNITLPTYSDSQLRQEYSTIPESKCVEVSYVPASRGNPPVLKYGNKYITALKTSTGALPAYELYYTSNGGNGLMNAESKHYGIEVKTKANAFSKKGHTFGGWTLSRISDGKIRYYNRSTGRYTWFKEGTQTSGFEKAVIPNGGKFTLLYGEDIDSYILTAKWNPFRFKCEFNANGGSGSMSYVIATFGQTLTLPENTFTKTNCTFAGWTLKRDSDNKWYYDDSSRKSGGWYEEGKQPSGYVKHVYSDKATITKASADNGDTIHFVAQWKTNKYTVRYNANGGSGSMSDSVVTYGVSQKLKTNSFTKTGYKFNGWYVKRTSDNKWIYTDGNGNSKWCVEGQQPSGYVKSRYKDGAAVSKTSNVNNDVVIFYAQWDPIKYTVKYNANGGSGSMSDSVVTYGVSQKLSANSFTKSGYKFIGWYVKRASDNTWLYTDGNGNGKWCVEGEQPSGYVKSRYKDGAAVSKTTTVNGDVVTFYAQWSK